jgi:hypothetical protein
MLDVKGTPPVSIPDRANSSRDHGIQKEGRTEQGLVATSQSCLGLCDPEKVIPPVCTQPHSG